MHVAMVTGAAQGLGASYARGLIQAGFQVAAVDLKDCTALVEEVGSDRIKGFQADMTSWDDTGRAVQEIEAAFGRIDVLVNNVGAFPYRPFLEVDYDFWKRILSVNLDSTFIACRQVVPGMVARRYGRIINIASGTVFKGVAQLSAYVSAKSGVIGLTRVLASELGPYGITVNCIAPGLTDTPGARSYTDNLTGEDANIARRAIPRRETPEDVVAAVNFFASESAGFVTGQTLVVDGGNVKH